MIMELLTDEQRMAREQQRAAQLAAEANTKNTQIAEQQRRMHAEASALTSGLQSTQAHDRASAAVRYAELEATFPELRSAAQQARTARLQAQTDYDQAHAQAQQHATTPPANRNAIDAWVEQGGALDRRVVGLGHLVRQTVDADDRAAAALRHAVEQRVHAQRVAAMRESNTRRRAIIAEIQRRRADLDTWANSELAALRTFETETLDPVEQLVDQGLVSGPQTPRRLENGLFDFD